MLQPTNRLTLTDAIRPPAGFELDAAMAVTFTLDLRALLAVPAALTLADRDDSAGSADDNESVELLHALRTHAGKLTVFSQAGEIALPPSRRVFAFLERAVLPVRAPRGGVVHPKVWVLRYRALDQLGGTQLRVVIASRNLTFDGSWDTVVRLDEGRRGNRTNLSPIGDLFTGLSEQTLRPAPDDHIKRVESLVDDLATARFALPDGVNRINVTTLGLGPTPSPLPTDSDRSLIISPFVEDGFFTDILPTPITQLVSRPQSLDGLSAEIRSPERITEISQFDDGSHCETDEKEGLAAGDPGRPLAGVHAKVFAFERGEQAHLFLGSANATGAAFRSNVEILVELVGSIEDLGIDRLCGGDGDERGLHELFHPYEPSEIEAEPDSEEGGALDSFRRELASLPITGSVERSDSGWAVTYRTSAPVPARPDLTIVCWPLTSAGNRHRVETGSPLDVTIETTLEAMSGFLAFEIRDSDGCHTECVVPVDLVGVPEERERILLKALIGGSERFLQYLLALLDDDLESLAQLESKPRMTGATGDSVGAVAGMPVLEKMLRTMRRDPARLDALAPLVADLAREDALPAGFDELWTSLRTAQESGAKR